MSAHVQVEGLCKRFPVKTAPWSKPVTVYAVQGVSFSIPKGQTLGLVGESGCGKSTIGKTLLHLFPPTSGTILFNGKDITAPRAGELKDLRRKMQIIFQDPYASLNPRMTVGTAIEEALVIHRLCDGKKQRLKRVEELLALVGLGKGAQFRYPHEFSGGQRQRVGIARALAVEPEFIICDEPVSALDVSIQAQIINLLMELQERLNLTYLFISHDLKVVEHISHQVAVMYLGRVVEMGATHSLFQNPKHPYTRALLSAIPSVEVGEKRNRILLEGDPPKATEPPAGCVFHTRCFMAESQCAITEQKLAAVEGAGNHQVACFLSGK